jgi:HK97 family phage prohead protease
MPKEQRTFDLSELRVSREDKPRIVGHAAVFNVMGDGGWFREKVAPGAFADSIQTDDVRALFNHDPNFVLGRNRSGTLKLSEDERGLKIEIEPPDTQVARDLLVSLERGDINQMSFGFQVVKDSWEHNSEGNALDIRTLEKVRLWDVSPVTFPFYKETDVAVRSHEAWQKTLNEPEPTWNRIPNMRRKLKLQEWR